MMFQGRQQEATPSVYFNFDNSNQKTNENHFDNSYIPYDYSFSGNKHQISVNKNQEKINQQLECQFSTPPSYLRLSNICKNLLEQNQQSSNIRSKRKDKLQSKGVKLNTQQFFDDFDKKFDINFGDSPNKHENGVQFRRTFQSYPGINRDLMNSKIGSNISQPIARRLSIEAHQVENQQDIVANNDKITSRQEEACMPQKQNRPPNENHQKSKVNCQIRKRVLFKNNEKALNQLSKRRNQNINKIIKHENLLIVTSNNWTDLPKQKKVPLQVSSQPIKRTEKTMKKTESNIFTTRHMFKQTLRSTTLDSWRKKFTFLKNQLELKHKVRNHNIFQKPFSLIR